MGLVTEIATDEAALERTRRKWDELAIRLGRPFSAPGWVMAWWANTHPPGAQLRAVLVREGDALVAVAPLIARGGGYELAGSAVSVVEPLAAPGHEMEAAVALAEALAEADPRPRGLRLQLHDDSGDWAGRLAGGWPRPGAWRWQTSTTTVPFIDLAGESLEAWLAAKSSSFRRETRRKSRMLDEADGRFRLATGETLARDIADFLRLHLSRRSSLGGSNLDDDRMAAFLLAAGRELLPEGRFRLICMEVEGRTVASQLMLGAGDELSAWNSGFDEAYADYSPSQQTLLQALREGFELGARTMSLGPGAQAYKYRFANRGVPLRDQLLLPRGLGYPLARARLAPRQARRWAAEHAPERLRRRLGRASA